MELNPELKQAEDISLKEAEPSSEELEPYWLPSKEFLTKNDSAPYVVSPQEGGSSPSPGQAALSAVGLLLCGVILSTGQTYMMIAMAVGSAEMAASCWNLSFQQVLFNCGPQDSFMGVFILAAMPIFWWAWYFQRRRVLKYLCFVLLGGPIAFLLSSSLASVSSVAQVTIAAATLILLGFYHLSGSFFSRFRPCWPRSFSVTKWLLIAYVPAIILFTLEFVGLDFQANRVEEKVQVGSMYETMGLIIAFCWLPALLTGLNSKTKRLQSALGLCLLGQLPVLFSSIIYSLGSLAMLIAFATMGGESLSRFFGQIAPPGMEPDFIFTAESFTQLLAKFVSSLVFFLGAVGGIAGGSWLAVFFNRRKNSEK